MKILLSVLILLMAFSVNAQNNFLTPDSSTQIIVNGLGGVASSSIPQNFMNKFIFPGFIDDNLKKEASDKMKNKNYFGGNAIGNVNILFSALNDTSKKSNLFGFGFGTRTEVDLRFNKDLFYLTFYGNQPFAGTTLNLNNTNFNALSYSFLEFSFGRSKITSNTCTSLWGDIGLVLGHGFTDLNLKNASIFTEQNGDYLALSASESSISMSENLTTSSPKGLGAKFDIHYSQQTESSNLLISVENIGGILWRNATSADIDTTFYFEGIEIENIFQLSDSVWNQFSSIDSLITSKKEDIFKIIPIDFTVYYKKKLNLIYFDLLARHRLFANYTPFVRAGLNFDLPLFNPGITAAYGGYSNLRIGLNTDIKLINALKIQIGTNNVLGAIIPKSTNALDVYAGLLFRF